MTHQCSRRAALKLGGAAALATTLSACGSVQLLPTVNEPAATPAPTETATPETTPQPETAQPISGQYRGMWVSYLEWMTADFSSESAFASYLNTVFDNCVSLGLNTVILQVRPFGDAFYPSAYYPWSEYITGTQGLAPDFDPLAMMIEQAHARNLRAEAWINPYRLRLDATRPASLAETNLYYTHPEWVVAVGDGLYLNPALQAAADYVTEGVAEIIEQYAVDGIHFDDYFYPTTEDYIDQAEFEASGETDRDTWRCANVSALVKQVYDRIKAYDENITFGISPQGNPDNNKTQQFSDVERWLNPAAGEECADYICPQVYWGYGYTMQSGSERFAFENITAEWLALPRAASVALTFGLGAYRIGDGDGGQNENSTSQWNTGENLATMVADLNETDADGYALYRYDSLYNSAYPDLAAMECAMLAQYHELTDE